MTVLQERLTIRDVQEHLQRVAHFQTHTVRVTVQTLGIGIIIQLQTVLSLAPVFTQVWQERTRRIWLLFKWERVVV